MPMYGDSWPKMPDEDLHARSRRARSPRHLTPPGTFAKKETTSRASPSSGMIIIPLMPWTMKPATPVKLRSSDSKAALSRVPPSSTQLPSPATAKTIAIAWMTTSTAMMIARIR